MFGLKTSCWWSKCNLVGTRPVTGTAPVTSCCSRPAANCTPRECCPPTTTCMLVAEASEREKQSLTWGLSLTFGPHADIVQKTAGRRTVEMVVKQLVSFLRWRRRFFFFFFFLPFCIDPSCVAPPFFEALSLSVAHFFALHGRVTLLSLFHSKYVQLIARILFLFLHLVGRFNCLLWRRPSKLLCFYFSPCEKRLVQAFLFFRTCAQAWVWVNFF